MILGTEEFGTGALKSLVDHLRRQFLLMLPMGVLSVIILGVPLFMWSSHLSMPVFDALVGGVVFVVCSYIVLLSISLVPMLMLSFVYPFLRGFRKGGIPKKDEVTCSFWLFKTATLHAPTSCSSNAKLRIYTNGGSFQYSLCWCNILLKLLYRSDLFICCR